MNYYKKTADGASLEIARFSPGGAEEIHLLVKPEPQGNFAAQLAAILRAQQLFLEGNHLPGDALVFSRYFVSDYANQTEVLNLIKAHSPAGVRLPALSIVQQPLLTGPKVAVWSHIIHDKNQSVSNSSVLDGHSLLLERGGYRHLWSARLLANDLAPDSFGQTDQLFRDYHRLLAQNGFSLKDDCLRTWLFVKDIDFNYQGVVVARRQFFDEVDLTVDTHFIASTGIEGRSANPRASVLCDAYAVHGAAPGQIKFLQARDHLNPTHEYGVTFERGTSIDYGDRRHIFISGTASIDNKGEVLHVNDVSKQVARAVENISALLADADAAMRDVAQMIVYLRDPADTPAVTQYLEKNHPEIPKVFTWAPVCRPGWLVEIECIAIKAVENPAYANF